MSLQEYHARQRANAAQNAAEVERLVKAETAGRWIGSIPDLVKRIAELERRVADLERAAPTRGAQEDET